MAINILDLVRNILTPDVVSTASTTLGESESGIQRLFSGLVPAVLTGLASRSGSLNNGGLSALLDNASALLGDKEANLSHSLLGVLGNSSSFGPGSSYISGGDSILNTLFGSQSEPVTNALSNFSGIRTSSAKNLMRIAAPAILAAIGKYAAANNLGEQGILNWLASQKDAILGAIPPGFELGSFLGIGSLNNVFSSLTGQPAVARPTGTTTEYFQREPEKKSNPGLWIIGLLALGLLGWLLLRNKDEVKLDEAETVTAPAPPETENIGSSVKGRLDEFGNWLSDIGSETAINLADGTTLVVGDNSSEYKLYKFITEGTIDETDKTKNWISLDRVFFETGKSVLTAESAAQVKNIGAILRNFPNASVKIGGYTDNTGDAAINKKISAERAKIVGSELLKAGAAAKQIVETEGYGPEHPIASNDTDEGRAQNRRVDIKVASK